MEVLFSQKIEFSTIVPFKNYSNIFNKIEIMPIDIELSRLDPDKDPNPFDDFTESKTIQVLTRNKNSGNEGSIYLDNPKKKKGKYFYLQSDTDPEMDAHLQIDLDYALSREKIGFTTTKERHLKRHFGNPFSSINIERIERNIIRRDNKITIKLYHRYKRRDINWKFFKTSTFINSITVDTTTGNFTITEIINSKEKKIKKFRRNYFSNLLNLINHNKLFLMRPDICGNEIKSEFAQIFDNNAFYNAVNDVFGFKPITTWDHNGELVVKVDSIQSMKEDFIRNFMFYFSLTKKIKIPNNFEELLTYYYPTEKYLKKNKRKLIASILDKYGIKSGVTIKLLHTIPNIDIITLVKLSMLLGKEYPKYIGNIIATNFDTCRYITRSIDYDILAQIQQFKPAEFTKYELSDGERENIITIINSLMADRRRLSSNVMLKSFYGSLMDHFDMINKIRPYVPTVYLNARNYPDFIKEHTEYSKILSLIKKPFVIEYVFDEKTVKEIEKRIPMIPFEKDYTDEDYLYPVLLKREEEYSEEGSHMHHCVASYASKESSIIISLRTHDGEGRVTSEFDIKTGDCRQSKHFYNASVPENFEYALTTVKNRVNSLARKNELKWKEKKQVRAVINGMEIPDAPLVLGPRDEDAAQPINNYQQLQLEDVDYVW